MDVQTRGSGERLVFKGIGQDEIILRMNQRELREERPWRDEAVACEVGAGVVVPVEEFQAKRVFLGGESSQFYQSLMIG